MAWFRMAKGAHAKAKSAEDKKERKMWDKHVDSCVEHCNKIMTEIRKGKKSIVGDISKSVINKTKTMIKLPLEIFLAERAKDKKQQSVVVEQLSAAKALCSQLLLSNDYNSVEVAKKQIAIVTAYLEAWVPDYDPTKLTVGEAIAQGDNLYEKYMDARARGEKNENLFNILSEMREKFLVAKGLLSTNNSISSRMRLDYTAKCWYHIGISSYMMDDFYIAYISFQHLLQSFNDKRFTAEDYPEIDKFRKIASRNVVAAAASKSKKTSADFDKKLYAESLIWRITYESSKESKDKKGDSGNKDKIKDFYYEVGEQYRKIGLYREAYNWYSKTPKDSKLFRFSFLIKGGAALKLSKKLIATAVKADKRAERIRVSMKKMTKREKEGAEQVIETLSRTSLESRNNAKVWLAKAEKGVRDFLKYLDEFDKKYGKNIPDRYQNIHKQELKNRYNAYLQIMQIKINAKDYDAVRKIAQKLNTSELPADIKQKVNAKWFEFLANIDAVDYKTASIDDVYECMKNAEKVVAEISKIADSEDQIAVQSKMLMGSRWLKLADRAKDTAPDRANEFRRYAGDMFSKTTQVVKKDIRFAIMVGQIFTDEKMYAKAEEIYTLGLDVWDKEEKYPQLITKEEYEAEIKNVKAIVFARTGDSAKAKKMLKLHRDLEKNIFGEKADFRAGIAKIKEIKKYASKIAVNTMKKSPTDKILTEIDGALQFRRFLIIIKKNIVLAKVALEKWDDALALIDDLLLHFKNDSKYLILKGDVYFAMASKIKDYSEAKDKIDSIIKLCRELTVIKQKVVVVDGKKKRVENPNILPKFSRSWWEAYGLCYRAQALETVLKKDVKGAGKIMKDIKNWQKRKDEKNNKFRVSDEFMRRSQLAFISLEDAGYSAQRINKELLEKAKRDAEKRIREMRISRENKLIPMLKRKIDTAMFLENTRKKTKEAKEVAKELAVKLIKEMNDENSTEKFLKEMTVVLNKLKQSKLIDDEELLKKLESINKSK